ncbi:MAG TPA: SDR family NAD(P)-dependent oxidoreductase, partial [Polyangiaceae bacterium]|nr:SDR family NAD(P)-dependent oxidoreductase [Polyangiaceae bacterium]
SPRFVESVLAATELLGVDGALLDVHRMASDPRGARALKAIVRPLGHLIVCGRAAELDASQVGSVLRNSVNFSIADVSTLRDAQPDLCRALLREVTERFERKQLVPMEVETFSWSDASQALARLVVTNQVGWMGLNFETEAPLLAGGLEASVIRAEGTYLVTGGLGGLGLAVMHWLAAEGARSIVLVGRSEPSLEARLAMEAVRGLGVSVTVVAADVSNSADVARVLRIIEAELPPLRGILHAAGVLDDGMIAHQSDARLLKVLAPKVQGAWNLHQQTLHLELELFVLFSSIASVVGWAGQSNYAAGNAFMDGLAQYRRIQGLKALSVNWGPWGGAGMAANLDERSAQRMREAGLSPLAADAALTAMRRLLSAQVPQAGVFEIDWASLFQFEADPARKTVFKDLLPSRALDSQGDLKQQLSALDEPERSSLVSNQVRQQLAGVLGLESGAGLDPSGNVFDYGLNSLMAMDLVNRLQGALQMKLPATLVLKHPTIDAMTRCILEQLRSSEAPLRNQHTYWDPESSVSLAQYELNGRLATITPTVLQLMFEEHTAHFNVGMLVEIDHAAFDLEALKSALNVLFTYHDGCRLRIFAENGQMQQEIAPLGAGVIVEEHDLRGLGYEAGAARMLELNEALHRSLAFTREGPLYRAAHYQLDGDPRHRFFLMFHHYVSDGWSQKLLSRELGVIYNKIVRRKPVLLPAKGYSLFDWTQRFKDFAYGEAVGQIPYWLAQLKAAEDCEIFDEVPGQREPGIDDYTGESGMLEREDQIKISEYCKAHGVELADVATYAIVRAFAPLTRSDALWADLITHARAGIFPDVTLPDLFGQISESGAVLFRLRPGASHLEQIAAIREQRLAVPHAGLGLRALRLINRDPEVKSQILMRHAPQVGLNIDVTDYAQEASQESGVRFAREPFGTASAQHQRKSPEEVRLAFFVALRQSEGRLFLSVDFYRNRFKSETIRRIIDSALDLLLEIAVEGESARPVSTPPPAFSADAAGLATAV